MIRGELLFSSSNRWWRSRHHNSPQTSSPKSLLTLPHSGKTACLSEASVKKQEEFSWLSPVVLIHDACIHPQSTDGPVLAAEQQRWLCPSPAELRAKEGVSTGSHSSPHCKSRHGDMHRVFGGRRGTALGWVSGGNKCWAGTLWGTSKRKGNRGGRGIPGRRDSVHHIAKGRNSFMGILSPVMLTGA